MCTVFKLRPIVGDNTRDQRHSSGFEEETNSNHQPQARVNLFDCRHNTLRLLNFGAGV